MADVPYYSNQDSFISRWGASNILQWSDLDSLNVIDPARVNTSLLYADSVIDSQFYAGGIFACGPGQHLTFASTTMGARLANEWANIIAGVNLYLVKSSMDDFYKSKLQPALDLTMQQMRLTSSDTKNAGGFDATRRWPAGNAPTGVYPIFPGYRRVWGSGRGQ